jgi:exopolysaccharide biosynthesis predicted pyruvyltransferase EpsI
LASANSHTRFKAPGDTEPAPDSRAVGHRLQLPPASADAVLIWPRGGNSGDALILEACKRYLKQNGIDVWTSEGSIEEAALRNDTEFLHDFFSTFRGMVMFPGGGNIGIYPDNAVIRSAVIAHMGRRHRCLVFSQSAVQAEVALIDDRVTVWCRDAVSKDILSKAGVRTELVPDVSLHMDDVIPKAPEGNGTFYIKRTPGVDTETINHGLTFECPSSDLTLQTPIETVEATLRPFETVISDRLHGGLIALMMRKKTVFLPVGYHKIKSFYSTWLQDEPGAAYAESAPELMNALIKLKTPETAFATLFRRYADAAFERFLLRA